jgi:hypothetical protein
LAELAWCEDQHSRETWFILVRAPRKRVKALRPVATCLYYDLVGMARWRL